jgi:hypothetical protein
MQSVHPKKINEMQSYKEIWKDVPEYEGVYQVSSLGRVKSLWFGKEKILKLRENTQGYMQVGLYKEGDVKSYRVHRLIMRLFVGESKLQVNHKNGIKTDNRLENLEYCTRSENMIHAYDIGLKIPVKGEKNGRSKITRACAERIKYGHKGESVKCIASKYGISLWIVYRIRSGKLWNHI